MRPDLAMLTLPVAPSIVLPIYVMSWSVPVARETAARVAVGSIARQFLECFGVRVCGHTRSIGPVQVDLRIPQDVAVESIASRAAENDLAMLDGSLYDDAVAEITAARKAGDTVGGVVEVIVDGLPPGLGSHVHWGSETRRPAWRKRCAVFPPSRVWKSVPLLKMQSGAARWCMTR